MNANDFKFDNTGYTITTVQSMPNGHVKIEHRPKTGKEMLADWNY